VPHRPRQQQPSLVKESPVRLDQLVTIQNLEEQATRLGVNIREFYTSLIAFTLISYLIDWVFIDPTSPLNDLFSRFESTLRSRCEGLANQAKDRIKQYADGSLLKLARQKLDDVRAKLTPAQLETEKFRVLLNQAEEQYRESEKKHASMATSTLLNRLNDANPSKLEAIYQRCTYWQAIEYLTLPKGLFMLLAKRAMDRFFRQYPLFGEAGKPCSSKALSVLSEQEAGDYIDRLKRFCTSQTRKADMYWYLRNGISAAYLAWHVLFQSARVNVSDDEHASAVPAMFFTSAVSSLVESGISFVAKRYRAWRLPSTIKKQQAILCDVCDGLGVRPQHVESLVFERDRLDRVYFRVSLPTFIENFKGRQWVKILHRLFFEAGFEVVASGGSELFIRADFKCSLDQQVRLKQKIASINVTIKELNFIKQQVVRIMKATRISAQFIPGFDHDTGLPVDHWEGCVPVMQKAALNDLLAVLFLPENIRYTEEDGKLYFDVTGSRRLESAKEQECINNYQPALRVIEPTRADSAASSTEAAVQPGVLDERLPKARRVRLEQPYEADSAAPAKPIRKQAHWGGVHYDSEHPSPNLVMLQNGHAPAGRQFALWTLTPEDFPSQEAYEACHRVFLMATVVGAKGTQGFKYCANTEKDGWSRSAFFSEMKVKVKGECGDFRVQMDKRLADGGESLYTTRAVTRH